MFLSHCGYRVARLKTTSCLVRRWTEKGERGINLSGGQKQRTQIARALYHDADIYLFDDPFSALDAHTGSHLFKEVLLGALSSKTVIYVTHQLQFLNAADLILVMKDGKITQSGKYSDILNSGTDFMELPGAHGGPVSENINTSKENCGRSSNGVVNKEENKDIQNDKAGEVAEAKGQLVQEEEREKDFLSGPSNRQQLLDGFGTPVSEDAKQSVGGFTLIIVYVALAIGSSVPFVYFAEPHFLQRLDTKLPVFSFNKMHLCIFRAPMSFFDATPSGRILNRASTDQSVFDLKIPSQVGSLAFLITQLLGIIIVMSQVAWQVFLVIPVIASSIWYQVRYALHLPVVLRGLTCSFLGGMKTGIVGRTGSGKSTLIQTIFWIVELAAGQIMIDGIDISSIGLHDLRSRLSIIPQDPTMFEGTALDKCQLGDEVRKKEGELDSKVTENGENWSMGQRQLVCLGCLLLKKSKVPVLDEATAFVGTATDNLIQQTLRQHFSDCTVITIAHRITSVIATDMVLLLNNGLIEEYDSPSKLLENKSSSFAQLVAEYTVAVLLLAEINPKSVAVRNATGVSRFVVRPVAWLSLVIYPVGRVVTLINGNDKSSWFERKKRGAELSGAIEEEEQDMIENVLEIKDTHVREVMTPLVDVVATDASATLVAFRTLRVTHQYSRVPVIEQRVDNIVGIAYAMDLLDYVQKGDLKESTTVGDMAHKPAYFVPGNP
ncbi:hypothetical protein Pint_03952 [Pistacia integerrima]|uniref:Uncharacterized protein n=1 Tax=Pistacia integerrima TaxID=434235 RepID=A0ACC0Z7G9_9ROSI|nr:hypothetical protein Pint_03952 [Pistacia integerrima]